MRRIYTMGETVMDIVFKNNEPVAAKAGGSMLNASVTLGRLGLPVTFLTEFGNDHVGAIIYSFLVENSVNTSFIYRFADGKSAIALAFLDEHQKADYSFYKFYPRERLKIEIPAFNSGDIVMFGSYFGIAPEIRPFLIKILTTARENGAIIIYDPNFRKAHLHQLNDLLPFILENFEIADIIKGSDEDFNNIFGVLTSADAFKALNKPGKILICSRGEQGVDFINVNNQFHLEAKTIDPVSTIGAGDNFNAGLAFGLSTFNMLKPDLLQADLNKWKNILKCGIDFATEVCLSYENYISDNFAKDYLTKNF